MHIVTVRDIACGYTINLHGSAYSYVSDTTSERRSLQNILIKGL